MHNIIYKLSKCVPLRLKNSICNGFILIVFPLEFKNDLPFSACITYSHWNRSLNLTVAREAPTKMLL
jgi:hypothetical protein